jgi:hypothetical protein
MLKFFYLMEKARQTIYFDVRRGDNAWQTIYFAVRFGSGTRQSFITKMMFQFSEVW